MPLDDEVMAAAAAAASLRPREAEVRGDLQQALSSQQTLVFALLNTLRALLRPVQSLESLARFESLRQDHNPLLPPVVCALNDITTALASAGIVPASALVGEPFDEERHERHSRGGVPPADDSLLDDLIVKEVVRPGYVHRATGAVLLPALVFASSASGGGKLPSSAVIESASEPQETPRGTRVHEVAATDTLQGIALRYGCQTATLMRLNKLPNVHALHARRTLRLPPPSRDGSYAGAPARSDVGEPLWGPLYPAASAPASGAVLVAGSGTASCSAAGEDEATGSSGSARSMAARIAARRRASSERRRDEAPASNADITSQGHNGGDHEPPPALVAEIKHALLVAKQQQQKEKSEGQAGGQNVDCTSWLQPVISQPVAALVATAIMQPWRAIGSADSPAEEMLFLRALAEHASEAALRALIDGAQQDGDERTNLGPTLASPIWQSLQALKRGPVPVATK